MSGELILVNVGQKQRKLLRKFRTTLCSCASDHVVESALPPEPSPDDSRGFALLDWIQILNLYAVGSSKKSALAVTTTE
jgi:hypothetical protein